jgi:hypothetical protein
MTEPVLTEPVLGETVLAVRATARVIAAGPR